MDQYKELAQAIINKMIPILGSMVVNKKCKAVTAIVVNDNNVVESISGDGKQAVESLVMIFKNVSGAAAIMFAKQAAKTILVKYPNLDIPADLK